MSNDTQCAAITDDGRRCQLDDGHKPRSKSGHRFACILGKTCTCMLRWHPNRCESHPEENG